VTRAVAIRRYFATNEHPVTTSELHALTAHERDELARAIAAETGWEIVERTSAGQAEKGAV